MRVGIISANWGMVAHLPAWQANGVEVAAVCTAHEDTARAASARYGIERAYSDYRDMVADPSLDIIDVGTRPDLRRDMVLAALSAGRHVFAAANFAADLSAARDMRDAARAAGTVCVLDSTLAAIPVHREMARRVAAGDIGRAVSASARLHISLFNGPTPIGQHWQWFGTRRHGASALRNLGTHTLHAMCDALGPVASVSAQEAYAQREWRFPDGTSRRPEVADTAQLLMTFVSGAAATVDLGWASPALVGWHFQINGETGTLVAEAPGDWLPTSRTVRLLGGAEARPLEPIVVANDRALLHDAPPQATDIARLLADFVGAAKGRGTAQPDFERAYHVEKVLEAARLAVAQRRWVDLEEISE